MKTLPPERKQDSFEAGNVTTELLLPLGRCHHRGLTEDWMLGRGLGWAQDLRWGCRSLPTGRGALLVTEASRHKGDGGQAPSILEG